MEGMLTMLLSGGYIGFLPRQYAQRWVDAGQLYEIDNGATRYVSEHALMTKSGGQEPEALQKFVRLLRDAAASSAAVQEAT